MSMNGCSGWRRTWRKKKCRSRGLVIDNQLVNQAHTELLAKTIICALADSTTYAGKTPYIMCGDLSESRETYPDHYDESVWAASVIHELVHGCLSSHPCHYLARRIEMPDCGRLFLFLRECSRWLFLHNRIQSCQTVFEDGHRSGFALQFCRAQGSWVVYQCRLNCIPRR